MTGGISRGLPSGDSATNVRYEEFVWRTTPVSRSSTKTFAPTSIEVRNTRFTLAFTMTSWPIRIGWRNVMWSTEAVTTGQRAWRMAAVAAARSTRCMMRPPRRLPSVLA